MIESRVKLDDYRNRAAKVMIHDTEVALWEARLASALIERWGIVAGAPDGEDSAGRAKLRLMTSEELVERACDTAGKAVAEFRARGWVHNCPSLADMDAAEKPSDGED